MMLMPLTCQWAGSVMECGSCARCSVDDTITGSARTARSFSGQPDVSDDETDGRIASLSAASSPPPMVRANLKGAQPRAEKKTRAILVSRYNL
eukprot:653537-Rhodomonas_salina.3